MRRKVTDIAYPIIKTIKPWMWHKCRFCGYEFKREEGFKIIDYKEYYVTKDIPLDEYYCCSECAKTKEDVEKLIEESKRHELKLTKL